MNRTTNGTPRQRKPRPKPPRSIRILEQPGPDTDGWAAIEIAVGKQVDRYLLHTIPTDFGNRALAFEVEKLDADRATVETVHVHRSDNPAERSCDCKGHERHGHGKHREGIQTALQTGRLRLGSVADLAANDPDAHREHEAVIAGVFTPNPKDCPEPDPAA